MPILRILFVSIAPFIAGFAGGFIGGFIGGFARGFTGHASALGWSQWVTIATTIVAAWALGRLLGGVRGGPSVMEFAIGCLLYVGVNVYLVSQVSHTATMETGLVMGVLLAIMTFVGGFIGNTAVGAVITPIQQSNR